MFVVWDGGRGCEAARRGLAGIYSESCRARIDKESAVREPERFERVNKVLKMLTMQDEKTQDQVVQSTGSDGNLGLTMTRRMLAK